ncbi:MAG: type II toxin-antitoxin system prevent-host-death family antitoxin [Microthrixaceae bacterium]
MIKFFCKSRNERLTISTNEIRPIDTAIKKLLPHPTRFVAPSATVVDVTDEISQRELRNDSGRIMRAVTEGETFIITRNGEPVGELTPLRRHRFIRAEAAVEFFRTAPPVDFVQFREDLDSIADQDIAPRA